MKAGAGQGGCALCWLDGGLKVASFLCFTALTGNFLDVFWRRWRSTVVKSHPELKIVLWASRRTLGSSQGWLELAGKQLQSWPLAAVFCNSPLVSLILDNYGFDGGSYGLGGAGGTPTSSPVDLGVAGDPCPARGSSSSSFSPGFFLCFLLFSSFQQRAPPLQLWLFIELGEA